MKRYKINKKIFLLVLISIIIIVSCLSSCRCNGSKKSENHHKDENNDHHVFENYKYTVVVANDFIANLVKVISGNRIIVYSIMKPDIMPSLYKPSKEDIKTINEADLFLYNSLDISPELKKVIKKNKKKSYDVIKGLDKKRFIKSKKFKSGYDPHIWFDVDSWQKVLLIVTQRLVELDPDFENSYKSNYFRYGQSISFMKRYINGWIPKIPGKKRIIIIQNNVFNYLLNEFRFKIFSYDYVLTKDNEIDKEKLDEIINIIIENEIPVIFSEWNCNNEFIKIVKNELDKRNYNIKVSEDLYTYFLGEQGTEEFHYINAFRKNIDIIYNSLK